MPTRLKRPAIWRPLALTVALLSFQVYLGFAAIGGQYGIENRKSILSDIQGLKGQSSALQADIDAYRHRAALFSAERLDPDIITERARALLNMANVDDRIIMVDPATGKPKSSSVAELPQDQLNAVFDASTDH